MPPYLNPIPESSFPEPQKDVPKRFLHPDASLEDAQRKRVLEMEERREKYFKENCDKWNQGFKLNKRGFITLSRSSKVVPYQLPSRKPLTQEESYESLKKNPWVVIDAGRPTPPLPHRWNVNIDLDYQKIFEDKEVFDEDQIVRDLPELNIKRDPDQYETLKKGAALAISEYNTDEKTNYRFVDIEKVHYELISGIRYYMIFRARMNRELVDTFKSIVRTNRVEIVVEGIQIKRPGSKWHYGTFRELIK